MLDFLKRQKAKLENKIAEARAKVKESEDIEEVRAMGEAIEVLNEELKEVDAKIQEVEEAEGNDDGDNDGDAEPAPEGNDDDAQSRSFNPLASYSQRGATNNKEGGEEMSELGTMEYRKAFMNYIQRGEVNKEVLKFEKRADAAGVAQDLGVLIPETVVQEIITGVEKVYGQLYSKVKKLNVPGGVKFPIGSFSATFNRIEEGKVSDRQNAGGITGSVTFSYKIGEIRLAKTLLQTVLSVPAFEKEFAKVIVEAYVEAMDKEIMVGTEDANQCEGILTEAAKGAAGRIPQGNIISFTDADMKDWTKWQEKLFAKIPLSMRSLKAEFAMTSNTYEANIKTLKDQNDRPVYNETFNPVDGSEVCKFKGKDVQLVEEDILKNFNEAANGEYFGMYWVPEKAYGINTNLQFSVVDYFDHDTNQYIKKALVINDGKVLDGKYIFLLKKEVSA